MKPLYDLLEEINRLFIAGSKFAKGDPRLAKYVPIFNRLGEKVPVFKKLAQDTDELTQTASDESADKLLGLGTLLYSVLYTQGNTIEEDAEIKPLEPTVLLNDINTSASYLELSPIIEALTTTQSGRMNVVEEGFKCGVFNDFRTYEYVNRALGDKYAGLADYIEQTIIPSTGIKMLPLLVSTFSCEGRPEDIRRFRLLYALKYPGLPEIVTTVLAGSSPPTLQVEAVRVLGDDIANQSLVMTLAADKHKHLREEAYQVLARFNTPESRARLEEIFVKNKNKKNIQSIIDALKLCTGSLPVGISKLTKDDFNHY